MALLEAKNIRKVYATRFGGNQVQALTDVSFTVDEGEYVAIMGESGSGKTTLLNILAALDRPTSGMVLLDGKDISAIRENQLAAFRRDQLGFVFQDFNLLEKYPYEVSGGQKQRAAVCRALITHPRLILADEPTGALDSRATDALLDVFQQINLTGQTLLMVTHSLKAASRAGRILFIRDGQVYHQLYRGEMTNEQFYEKISDALTVMTRKDAMDGEMA